jgi:hypothetical protein
LAARPERTFQLACDGAYAPLCGAGLVRIKLTSRLRRDAAVYELTLPRTGKRGRPRKTRRATGSPPLVAGRPNAGNVSDPTRTCRVPLALATRHHLAVVPRRVGYPTILDPDPLYASKPTPRSLTRSQRSASSCGTNELRQCAPTSRSQPKFETS